MLLSPYGDAVCGKVVFEVGDRDLPKVEEGSGEHGIGFAERECIREML